MDGKCNVLSFNEAVLFSALQGEAKLALTIEGERLISHMRREVKNTTHGDAPGKPAWRDDIARNISHTATAVSDDAVSMDFGYLPSDKVDLVRAMVVEDGSGSMVGNEGIHAGPTGRSVWDGNISGKHPSKAKTEYQLPAEFNQKGNQFVENAMKLMSTEFGAATEAVFGSTPDSVYYGNVQVSK